MSVPMLCLAGDILRGGGPANPARTPGANSANPATSTAADVARQHATDALARTTRAVQAVQQLQLQARAQAAAGNNLDPNHVGQQLPAVADGLRPGGLQINGAPTGADTPTEAVAGGHTTVTIKQQLQQAFLDWQTFNVGRNTTVHFDQTLGGKNAGQWIAFNTVKDPTGVPSQILGQIQAEGQVYILNQNGIIFGRNSQVDVHTLVASALPVNTNLVTRGLLNNPDVQYLFSALPIAAGTGGTPGFMPELNADKKIGDITVESGAQITAPTTADKVGGRIALIGANVTNDGTIYTPDGQTILAAGLQVGMVAHSSSDPSLRGLDVYVGSISDSIVGSYAGSAGTVTNTGHLESPRGNITLTGKTIEQSGALTATTSVSLNGRIDLNASYGAVSNSAYDPTNAAFGAPFLYNASGSITLGQDSITQITPELESTEKVVGTKLALASQVNMTGEIIHLEDGAMVLAPNANITINAGVWDLVPGEKPKSSFVLSSGQVYMDSGSSINVAGTTEVVAQMAENILTLQLRGSEFADFSYNRDGPLRGVDITLDVRRQGIFDGTAWAGTPLADASGFIGLIQRGVDQLTTAGGTVKINSGGSVVTQAGSSIDVSGGYINYLGGMVQTTRVAYGSQVFDISEATPDRVYDGIYTGTFTTTSAKWGVSNDYTVSLLLGTHYEAGYTYGAAGGSISINAPRMALDGQLLGNTINGTRQRELQAAPSTLSLTFQAQRLQPSLYPVYSPTPPTVIFQSGVPQLAANPFALDANGHAIALRDDRVQNVVLSATLLSESGFGNLTVDNKDGDIIVAADESLIAQPKGSITLNGANVTVNGSIITPGGTISLNAYNISPSVADELKQSPTAVTPPPSAGRGLITLGSDALLDTSGMFIDDRLGRPDTLSDPFVLGGGSVTINGYSANLAAGSVIDVGGGARMDWLGKRTYGNAGGIVIKTGQDRSLPWVQGGELTLGSELLGMAGVGKRGGALTVQASLIQIGGSTSNPDVLLLQPGFFNQGGFSSHTLNSIGEAIGPDQYTPGLVVAPATVIEPVVQNFLYEPAEDGTGAMTLSTVTLPQALRSPVSLSFGALGSTDDFSRLLKVRGDLVFGEGAVIRAGPLGSVDFRGDTVNVLGSVFAPGGLIGIKGADKFPSLNPNPPEALATVYIGPDAHVSAAGAVVLTPDP
ncbi:MAG: filamentous hemagglutinin N-terminal domain-containing protein, partial [Prosthecobacter sp.]|nr:filamentous hemagglutinin N-terminal domain-containing protein [Prosthecobacter sp.]